MTVLFALGLGYYIWDLATEPATFTVWGADYHDGIGHNSLGIADFNGDGIDDLIIPTPVGDGPGNSRPSCGDIYIIFGRPGLSGSWDMANQPPDLAIYGPVEGWAMGYSLATGDVNGDGCGDILVSDLERHAYLIYGSDTLTGIRDLAVDSADYTIINDQSENRFGNMAIGDIDGDGFGDMVIELEGIRIFRGGDLHGTRFLSQQDAEMRIGGENVGKQFDLMDMDGDGDDDLLFRATVSYLVYHDWISDHYGCISYYIPEGYSYFEDIADYKLHSCWDSWFSYGVLGIYGVMGNPDHYPDLYLGHRGTSVIYGKAGGFHGDHIADYITPDLCIGTYTDKIAAADLNKDGWAEIIGGYPDAGKGKVQVFSLARHPYGEWDPDVDTADVVILADPDVNEFFRKLIAVGDVNGDGHPDLAVSDSYADHDGKEWTGAVYLFDLRDLISAADTGQREFPTLFLFPTITKGSLFLSFSLNSSCDVSWKVFDLSGRMMDKGDMGELDRGKHQESLFMGDLPQGVYILEFKRGDLRTRRVFAVVK